MSCYHPILLEPWFVEHSNPRRRMMTKNGKPAWKLIFDSDLKYDRLVHDDSCMLVPCGHCIGCRLDYSRTWADRLMLELMYHDSAYFVTLTYDDVHVPKVVTDYDDYCNPIEHLTLQKRDAQLWMKRLRKSFPNDKIRYYLAGEYGSKTIRPHYHAIVFGLHLSDLAFLKKNNLGHNYYTSASLARTWPFGFSMVADVNWNTCAYVARYVTKKIDGVRNIDFEDAGLEPPFSLMSQKPGIGFPYYEDHPECMETGIIDIPTEEGGRRIRVPRYFYKHLEQDNPELYRVSRETRIESARQSLKGLSQRVATPNHQEYLSSCEEHKKNVIKSLKRSDL